MKSHAVRHVINSVAVEVTAYCRDDESALPATVVSPANTSLREKFISVKFRRWPSSFQFALLFTSTSS